MDYHFSKTMDCSFEQALQRVEEELKKEGFGILTQIDVQETFQKKINEPFRPYRILGACNPNFAFMALNSENKIGTMLPCNVVVQQHNDGKVEVSAVRPTASMMAIENKALEEIARTVENKLESVIHNL